MDGVIGLIDRLLLGSAMVEFVPVTLEPQSHCAVIGNWG